MDNIKPNEVFPINPYFVILSQGCFNFKPLFMIKGITIAGDRQNKTKNAAKHHPKEVDINNITAHVIPIIGIRISKILATILDLSNLIVLNIRVHMCNIKNNIGKTILIIIVVY